ncbi:MAG: hypothetical protein EOM28_13150 [Clostridia bacterium]|nr:hypothetical protein [Anaerotignum sp.]NCC17245.1 hypothetical protein [Clostridia bacterium]
MFRILKSICILGAIFSMVLSVLGFVLFLSALKNKKYANKLVADTPLLKDSKVLLIGIILSTVFEISILILNFF